MAAKPTHPSKRLGFHALALVFTLLSGNAAGNDQVELPDRIADYIDSRFPAGAQRNAALQSAYAMERVLKVDLANLEAVRSANYELARADSCIYAVLEPGHDISAAKVSATLESLAVHTRHRLLRYLAFNKALDGGAWPTPHGEVCDDSPRTPP